MSFKKLVFFALFSLLLIGGSMWLWRAYEARNGVVTDESASEESKGTDHGNAGKHSRGGGRQHGDKPVPVLVTGVTKADVPIIHSALGTAIPSAVVTVTSRVNGQLIQVAFKEGELVKQGQLLAKIDPKPFETALAQIQGQAVRNQALLKNSQIDLERFKTLQSQDSIASQQVDSQASLVQQYQGTVQADHASVENARLQVSYTNIVAPIGGRIGLRQVDSGNNITTTNPLAVINAIHPIHVVFTLPEDKITRLIQQTNTPGSQHRFKVEAWDKSNVTRLATGYLTSIDNQIDTTSGTLKLKAEFSNEDNRLFPNQFINVRLYSDTIRNASVIPLNALQHGPDGAFVYKIVHDDKGDKVILQGVTVAHTNGEIAAITNGLAASDRVVSSGIDKLKQDARVKIKDPAQSFDDKEDRGTKEDGADKKSRRPHDAGAADQPTHKRRTDAHA
jgi:multidrug efflux system membrane fusion protein